MLYTLFSNYIASSIPMEYKSFLNRSIWPIDWTQTGTITPGQSGPGSNGNKGRGKINLSDIFNTKIKWDVKQHKLLTIITKHFFQGT